MAVPDPTPAFNRFRATGDPEALAVVFDATAAELLRVASHLVSDLFVAEDLVQSTFLTAIEHRGRFSPDHTVLPWLLGILTNHARRHRSSLSRRPDPERVAMQDTPGPEVAAADLELSQAVSDAIQHLPEPYRPVLMLHLRHGFSPQEIALDLGRSPGSVRSQLARGLNLLRRALPAGFAVTVSSAILPIQGLAAMRDVVLGAAKLATPASVVTAAIAPIAIGGVLLMKKTLLITTAIVGVASVAYLVWPDPPSQHVAATDTDTQTAFEDEREHNLGSSSRQDASSELRSGPHTNGEVARQNLPRPVLATIAGRCTTYDGADPLRGCRVTSADATATTGSDGGFRVEVRTSVTGQGQLLLAPSAGPGWQVKTSPFPLTEQVDVGEIRVPERTRFLAKVTSVDGAPIEGVGIRIRRMLDPPNDKGLYVVPPTIAVVGMSASGGTLKSPDVAAGTWSVEALGNYSVVEPGFVTVSRAREHERVRITVAMTPPGSSIGGIVVDEVGSPVADIDVTVMEQDITGRRVHGDCTTDARGRFRMQVKGNTQEVLSIQSIDPKKR